MWGRLPDKLKLKHDQATEGSSSYSRSDSEVGPRGLLYSPLLSCNIVDPLFLDHRRDAVTVGLLLLPNSSGSPQPAQLVSPCFLRSMEVTTGYLSG
jgi:hypothetical protein